MKRTLPSFLACCHTPLNMACQMPWVSLSLSPNSWKPAHTQPKSSFVFLGFSICFLLQMFADVCLSCIIQASPILKDSRMELQGQKARHWVRVACWMSSATRWGDGGSRAKRLWKLVLIFLSHLFSCINFPPSKVIGTCKYSVKDQRDMMFYKWTSLWSGWTQNEFRSCFGHCTISNFTKYKHYQRIFPPSSSSRSFKGNVFGWNLVMKN